jgi:hypothetical protein
MWQNKQGDRPTPCQATAMVIGLTVEADLLDE